MHVELLGPCYKTGRSTTTVRHPRRNWPSVGSVPPSPPHPPRESAPQVTRRAAFTHAIRAAGPSGPQELTHSRVGDSTIRPSSVRARGCHPRGRERAPRTTSAWVANRPGPRGTPHLGKLDSGTLAGSPGPGEVDAREEWLNGLMWSQADAGLTT